jgi:hypothetical protein
MVRDGFIEILGRKTDDPAVQLFFTSYAVKHTAGAKYSSTTNGIDIDTRNDSITTVNVYKNSPVYGRYTGKLSMGLAFGMIQAQVADILGKPTTTYNNPRYSEYNFEGYMITCRYEQRALTEVSLSPR